MRATRYGADACRFTTKPIRFAKGSRAQRKRARLAYMHRSSTQLRRWASQGLLPSVTEDAMQPWLAACYNALNQGKKHVTR